MNHNLLLFLSLLRVLSQYNFEVHLHMLNQFLLGTLCIYHEDIYEGLSLLLQELPRL